LNLFFVLIFVLIFLCLGRLALTTSLKSSETPIAGVFVVERLKRGDSRGYFERIYCASELAELGWKGGVAQVNHSFTQEKGVVRGMHYQLPPYAEYKLVSCLMGEVWDVALDLRMGSATYLQYFAIKLSSDAHTGLLIPPGCAHGFQTLTSDVDMVYCHSEQYEAQSDAGVNVLDPRCNILWPLEITQRSDRDQAFSFMSDDFKGVVL
jgi:dTDP-4-dehydrorhamnose 3,5-epimerase